MHRHRTPIVHLQEHFIYWFWNKQQATMAFKKFSNGGILFQRIIWNLNWHNLMISYIWKWSSNVALFCHIFLIIKLFSKDQNFNQLMYNCEFLPLIHPAKKYLFFNQRSNSLVEHTHINTYTYIINLLYFSTKQKKSKSNFF